MSEHIEDSDALAGWLESVFDDCCQIAKERLKAVGLHPIVGLLG
ncbi:MAG: hypothetical protein ABI693_21720 [Bryobacteraceae bacterium]